MDGSLERVKRWLSRGTGGALVGSQGALVGVDIGSYGLRAIVADLSGDHLHTADAPLPDGDAEATTAAALNLVRGILTESGTHTHHVARIGIGFGGLVDSAAGLTRISHRQAGWEQFPLAARFEEAFDASTLLDNDANVTALAEASCGAGSEVRDLFYLHLSTGVGGGVVVNGRLHQGATTTAGEIGHAVIDRNGPACSCGGRGHVESYVSVQALLRRLNELGVKSSDLNALFEQTAVAQQVLQETTELLGVVLANVIALNDPQMIVVGGITARTGGETFMEQLRVHIQRYQPPSFVRPIPVTLASFGSDSVAVGGLALALASLQE